MKPGEKKKRKKGGKAIGAETAEPTFGVAFPVLGIGASAGGLEELQVHQIELETQNAELAESRDQMALLLEKFTDFYDFAPIGYFSLDRQGRILELNLTGASLLGSERSALVKRPLARFVAPSCRTAFNEFLNKLFSEAGKQSCEVEFLKSGEVAFWACLHGGGAISPADSPEACRIALSDITSLKLAQEAQHRVEILSATNDELKREIATRQSVEEALRKSEQHQTLLLDKAQLLQNQFRDLSHRVIDAREEERKRISRELHDDITQTLVGITVNLEALAREAALKPGEIRHKIVQTQRIVEKAVRIVHDYARELRPTSLDDLGLIVTLHSLLNDFMARTGIRVRFRAFADVDKMGGRQRTVLFRIVQEALVNIDKHAEARQVEVNIRKIADSIQLEIADDGKSFDVERTLNDRNNKRLGLVGMREQAEMAGGTLTIESAPGAGTKVFVTMAFKNASRGHATT